MKLETYDNLIDYSTRDIIHTFCINSSFRLGWEDSYEETKRATKNLHSHWSEEDYKNSQLEPYIKKAFSLSKSFKYNLDKLWRVELNLVKSDDVHFIHTHNNRIVALYYVNLSWQDGWYGETIFYDKNNINDIKFTSSYVPGRIILFDGTTPHAIRPQSSMAPKFRFSVSVFFNK